MFLAQEPYSIQDGHQREWLTVDAKGSKFLAHGPYPEVVELLLEQGEPETDLHLGYGHLSLAWATNQN
jgi:hypothetical protein